ncbi:MAG: hypothetical protein Q4F06_03890 [Eubacteriales bacterium]|nr:hypothetical protein [Eubacteriales bacterium]
MDKNNDKRAIMIWTVVVMAVITALVICYFAVLYGKYVGINRDDKDIYDERQNNENVDAVPELTYKYMLVRQEDYFVIYKYVIKDGEIYRDFYDYAMINPEMCDDNLLGDLEIGIGFKDEEQLYDFLQAYSS